MTSQAVTILRRAFLALAVPAAVVLVAVTLTANRGRPISGTVGGAPMTVAWASFTVVVLGFVVVGVVVASRVPGHPIGWLLVVMGLFHGLAGALPGYAYLVLVRGFEAPGGALANWASSWVVVVAVVLMGFLPLLFPNGRLPSPAWRWPARLYAAAGAVYLVTAASISWPGRNVGIVDVADALPYLGNDALARLFSIFLMLTVMPLAAVIVRYRRGTAEERAQIRWLASASVISVGMQFVLGLNRDSHVVSAIAAMTTVLLPVAIAIAILRYRLYAIDRIISRTVTYGLVVATLLAVWVVGVVGLGTVLTARLGAEGNDLLVAASTLVIVVLFRPLRARVRSTVDRRFNRPGYQAERSVDSFPERLRNQVDLEAIRDEIVHTATAVTHPVAVSIWLRTSGHLQGDAEGRR